ncbi:MAG: hypothetical protein ACK43N_02650, partial [Pirellulaceae bacterium]
MDRRGRDGYTCPIFNANKIVPMLFVETSSNDVQRRCCRLSSPGEKSAIARTGTPGIPLTFAMVCIEFAHDKPSYYRALNGDLGAHIVHP